MLENPRLVEMPSEIHNKLKSNENIDMKYIKIEKKQTLKVYIDSSDYFIDISAAYALLLLNVEEFNNSQYEYYYITEEMINKLKEKYKIELYSLNLEKNSTGKKL